MSQQAHRNSALATTLCREMPSWLISHGIIASVWIASQVNGYGWDLRRYEGNLIVVLLTKKWWLPYLRAFWEEEWLPAWAEWRGREKSS